jgi:hypothetical protein
VPTDGLNNVPTSPTIAKAGAHNLGRPALGIDANPTLALFGMLFPPTPFENLIIIFVIFFIID